MRHPPLRRLVAGLGSLFLAAGVLSGIGVLAQLASSGPAGATTVKAGYCTITLTTGGTKSATLNSPSVTGQIAPVSFGTALTPGTTKIDFSCRHLPKTAATMANTIASPLSGVATFYITTGGTKTYTIGLGLNFTMNSPAAVASAVTPTNATLREYVGTLKVPAKAVGSNPDATCPPTQNEVDMGLTNCTFVVADTTGGKFGIVDLTYPSQPTAAAPTMTASPSGVQAGDTVTLASASTGAVPAAGSTAAGRFYGDEFGTQGTAGVGAPAIPAVVTATGTTGTPKTIATAVTITATKFHWATTSPAKATTQGTLTGATVSGTVHEPSGLPAGTVAYSVSEPNIAPTGSPYHTTPPVVTATATGTQLGTASITLSTTHGGPGTTVTITGANWDPQGGTVSVAFGTKCATCSGPDTGTATVSASGALTGHITLTAVSGSAAGDAAGANSVVVTQKGASGTTLTASKTFTVQAVSVLTSCTATGHPTTHCTINQVIDATVAGTTLSVTETAVTVTLSKVTLGSARFAVASGNLNQVTVNDSRGSLGGWTVTGQLTSDFKNLTSHGNKIDNVIPADFLTWTPTVSLETAGSLPGNNANTVTCPTATAGASCVGPSGLPAGSTVTSPAKDGTTLPTGHNGATGTTGTGGNSTIPAEVHNGVKAVLHNSTGSVDTLCTAPAGGGGGGFDCNAGLHLSVPPYVAAGKYTATMNIVVTGL